MTRKLHVSDHTIHALLSTAVVGAICVATPAWGQVSGSGTPNYVAKFTASGIIGNGLTFDNGTNVGIGTAGPQYRLHVVGASSAPQFAVGVDSNPLYNMQFTYTNPNGVIQVYNNGAGSILALNPAGGNIGVGTSAPRGRLDIPLIPAGYNADNLVLGGGTLPYPTSQYNGYGNIVFKGTTSDLRMMIQDGNGRLNTYWNAYTDSGGYKYIVSSEPAGREQMSISTDGFWSFYGAPAGTAGGAITWTQAAYIEPNVSVWLSPRGNSTDFYVANGGNVGIGTISPTYKLSVNGTIGTKEVIVTATGWSDYVFAPGYRLKPLEEIALYIKANHHLPDIPTEAEVKENGVSLGEMQSKLLARIEELTLHMIQEHERNDRLEQSVYQLQKQNQELRERIDHN